MRDRHDREMLDGVDLRLDEQVHVDAKQVRREEPDERERALHRERQRRLPVLERQPLVDRVDAALDALDEDAEDVDDEREQAGQRAVRELADPPQDEVGQCLLRLAAERGGEERAR